MLRPVLLILAVLNLPGLAGPGDPGQWVAVVAPGLRDALKPLEEARRKEGWQVTVLPAPEREEDLGGVRRRLAELAERPGAFCVVLAGNFAPEPGGFQVPAGKGTHLRMAGKWSDAPWNQIAGKPERQVETGRLPARSSAELAVMTAKILAWPEQRGVFPETRLVAGHHGAPPAFARMADGLTNTLARRLVSRLPAGWRMQGAVHIDGSPWQVSGNDFRTAAEEMTGSPVTLLAYMGHSAPFSPVSKNMAVLGVEEWRRRRQGPAGAGLFFSCGCFTAELDPENESFGFAAIRAPGGAAAVIGSHGETYAAFGFLAMSGLVEALGSGAGPAPERLGSLWLGVRAGLAAGEIAPAEFALLDMSDGTGGRVPLEAQRLEHLESWMLLGDPAMPLLPRPGRLALKATRLQKEGAGETVKVEGTVPPGAVTPGTKTAFRITLERHPGTIRTDLPEVAASGPERLETARRRRALSENVLLAEAAEVHSDPEGKFSTALTLPVPLPPGPWVLRAVSAGNPASGAAILLPESPGAPETRSE